MHSIGDIKHRLHLGAYDMCSEGPLAIISDHRPVSLALAVVVDTSQLPMLAELSLQPRRRDTSPLSDTAQAMAFAATSSRPRPRPHSMEPQPTVLQRPPSSSAPRAFPLLVRMAFSRFKFHFRGFDVLRSPRAHGTSMPFGSVTEEEGKEGEETKDEAAYAAAANAAELGMRDVLPWRPSVVAASATVAALDQSPRKSWLLRLPRLRSVGSSGGATEQQGGATTSEGVKEEEDLTFVDHVLIL